MKPFVASYQLTRPADTTAYAANDALANATSSPAAQTFSAHGAKGWGWIYNARAVSSAYQATLPQLRLYIFTATVVMTNDNAAFVLTDAELRMCIGYVDFLTWVAGDDTSGAGGNAISRGSIVQPIAVVMTTPDSQLVGKLKVLNAYTPVSAEVFDFYLSGYLA